MNRWIAAAVAALAVGTGLSPEAAADPGAAADSGAGPARAGGGVSVTLVTGDRVVLGPGGRVSVVPGAGREGIRFVRSTRGGQVSVLPADAAPLVAAGRLDRQLFNVSRLIADGYDDRSRADLPLIVARPAGLGPAGLAPAAVPGSRTVRVLPSIGGAAVVEGKATAGQFWAQASRGGLAHVWLDGTVRAALDRSVPQIGAPAAWAAGQTGQGVTVAVLDTGVDATHADLADAIVGAQDFTGSPTGTEDHVGHGTHVASIITGSGAASGGKYQGVAPDAKLLIGKVLDDTGFGTDSQIIAGMEWAASRARVVSMSLGSTTFSDGTAPMDQALNRLTAQTGALFVVAAGNAGPTVQSIGAPGAADGALTVGAVDRQDQLAAFSSRGPRTGDGALKPDITAPGVGIVAARAAGTDLGDPVDDSYTSLSGTSMATPHVSGAAAILAGEHPDWQAPQLKAALMASAAPQPGQGTFGQGAGRVDVARGVTQQVTTAPASISDGIAAWPHQDDQPVTTPVTYRNDGDDPVTLALSLDVRDPAGQPAAGGMFTLSAPQVTVPAHGTAAVSVTADTSVAGPDGAYGGRLTALAGGTRVVTPLGVVKEVESYTVTTEVLDRAGVPTDNYGLEFDSLATPDSFFPYDPSGTVVARLPKGTYVVTAFEFPAEGLVAFFEPRVVVDRDVHLTFDGRTTGPVGFAVDRPHATPSNAAVEVAYHAGFGDVDESLVGIIPGDLFLAPSRTRAPAGRFTFHASGRMSDGRTYVYDLGYRADGRVPGNLLRRFHDRDLAVVHARYAAVPPATAVQVDGVVTLPTPARLELLFAPGQPVSSNLVQQDVPGGQTLSTQTDMGRTFPRPGPQPDERWDAAVFGPAFPVDPAGGLWVFRQSGTLTAVVAMFADQAATHAGGSRLDSSRMALFRDGVLVGETSGGFFADFEVPADPATYRLETTADRHSYADLSTRVRAAWTFRSRGTPDADQHSLPLMAVRFAPDVDDRNRAPRGRFSFPVHLQRQQAATYGTLTRLEVQISYDDGRTWTAVPLTGHGDHRTATVTNPPTARYASLRALAADSAGNRVEETITHAYALR